MSSDLPTPNIFVSMLELKEAMEARVKDGDPIMAALQGKGLGLLDAFENWVDLELKADAIYYEALDSGLSVPHALAVLEHYKEHIAELIKREAH